VGEDSSTTSNMACTPTPGRHSRSSALAHRRFACVLEAGQVGARAARAWRA
jgi:hypothetical protein